MNSDERPNILLIMTDQHRLSAVGAYGDTVCQTPNIDRLADEGILFRNAYTPCPVCSPARASLMTGLYPHAHGITSNIHELSCAVHELHDRSTLLSRQLEQAGYELGYTGKWHLGTEETQTFGAENKPSLPRDVGFIGHSIPGHGEGGIGTNEYQTYLEEHGWQHQLKDWQYSEPKLRRAGELAGTVESTVPYFLTEHTLNMMDNFQKDEKPFFIWHNFWGPHEPYYVPTEFLEMYRDIDMPPWGNFEWDAQGTPGAHHVKIHPLAGQLSWEDWQVYVKHYYAFASLIDSQIGRMLNYLDETGLSENTIVVFVADHGETLGSHGGLVDKGWHHFEETHRIPLIIRTPQKQQIERNELVNLLDLYPTVLDFAEITVTHNCHGQSLKPLITGESIAWRDYALTEFGGLGHLGATMRTLRIGNLKYGFSAGYQDELYDLKLDPHEMTNRIDDGNFLHDLQMMRERLESIMHELDDPVLRMYRFALAQTP